jgi:hypothetical protein
LFDPALALRAETADGWLARFAGRVQGDAMLWVSHGQGPCREGTLVRRVPAGRKNYAAQRQPFLERVARADELIVVNSPVRPGGKPALFA